jgi:hypothetical protein
VQPGTILLLGEMHGTVEGPAYLGHFLCFAGTSRHPVIVGLEIPHQDQPLLDAFLASDGSAEAERALLRSEFWTRAYQDGRSSEAMLDLVRSLRPGFGFARTTPRVVLFDEQSPNRDAAMAARLAAAAERQPDAFLVVLTGNLHARLEKGSPWDPSFEPMGLFLRRSLPGRRILSLDVGHSGGEAWICTGSDAGSCGPRRLSGNDQRSRGVHMAPAGAAGHYSGHYVVGTLRVSPPAVAAPP